MRRISIGIFCAILLSSCSNVLRFEKDNVVAFGEKLNGSPEPLYYLIRIDMTESIDNQLESFLLKLSPDAQPISVKELHPELVSRYLQTFIPPPQWPDIVKEKIKDLDIYEKNGFNVSFKNGQLYSVSICSHCANGKESPVVGTPNGEHFYTLPLTEQQITEVFGSPDRVYKVLEVRY